ncbi:MAG: alpha/beta hydrolase, partial [Myxococcota bacterium]
SAKPVRPGAYSIPAHATRVFDALSSLGVQSFVLGLHDIGGFVGWEMLASSPHRIRGLVVANTSAYADGLSPAPRVAEIVSGMKTPQEAWEQLSAPEFASMVAREFLEIGVAEPTALSDQLVAAYAGPLSEGSSEAFIEFFEGIGPVLMAESARRQTLQAFPGEALVIHGTLDRFFSVDAVAPLFQSDFSLPESRVVRVEGAGHYVQEDAPAEYVEAVVNFLGGF